MRGILMIEPLFHQVIAGKKTQTRRSGGLDSVNTNPDGWTLGIMSVNEWSGSRVQLFFNKNNEHKMCEPRYKVGEVLYLKEPYILMGGEPVYKFDLDIDDKGRDYVTFKNKLFMPARHARAFIRITGIRCERLMDISDHDAIQEGIEQLPNGYYKDYNPMFNKSLTPLGSFVSLYILANKMKRTDNLVNIWVWVYEFTYLKDYPCTVQCRRLD